MNFYLLYSFFSTGSIKYLRFSWYLLEGKLQVNLYGLSANPAHEKRVLQVNLRTLSPHLRAGLMRTSPSLRYGSVIINPPIIATKKLQENKFSGAFCMRLLANYLFENCGALRAALRPYFFLSFIRGSLVRYPAFLSAGLYSASASRSALEIPCLIAPA